MTIEGATPSIVPKNRLSAITERSGCYGAVLAHLRNKTCGGASIVGQKRVDRSLVLSLATGLLLLASMAGADDGMVKAGVLTIRDRLTGFGQVVPIVVLKLNAAQAGVVNGLQILPGESVSLGSILGRLTGPGIESGLAQRRAEAESARAAFTAAGKVLAIARRQQKAQLATQKEVDRTTADLSESRARLDKALTELQAFQEAVTLKAAVDGTVLTVDAADGEQVQAGQTILSLLPKNRLWLKAVFYGSEAAAVHVGMNGSFAPVSGAAAIAVQVRSVMGALETDGGQAVGLVAAASQPGWRNGEAGPVMLEGGERTLVAVPTRALILDQGKWWLLVHTSQGNRPRQVVTGPSRGELTSIVQGLEAGTAVVVENAYLEFHRAFSKQYQPPD